MQITQDSHPLLDCICFIANYPDTLANSPSPEWLTDLLLPEPKLSSLPVPAPDEQIQKAMRQVLRWGGFKPSGRSKPASEYLVRAAGAGELNSINAAVDILNAVSLHTGLPIGVIDLDLATPPLHIGIGRPEEHYIFNASGQDMELKGLICMYDAQGPCANPVKDSQRTKTNANTRRSLTIVWGSLEHPEVTQRCAAWYKELLGKIGATVEDVEVVRPD